MILNLAHLLETAFLLLAAFLTGATIGSLARVIVLRLGQKPPETVVETGSEALVSEQPTLVVAPVIDPVVKPAAPQPPALVPVPDFSDVIALTASAAETPEMGGPPQFQVVSAGAPPKPVMAPARVAGQTTSGVLVPSPRAATAARMEARSGPGADVIPFPSAGAADSETGSPPPPADASSATGAFSDGSLPGSLDSMPDAEVPISAPGDTSAVDDEAAVMRAIEGGGWSPKRRPSRAARRAPEPDGVAADEPVRGTRSASVDEAPGRPKGIEGPRDGGRDDLTNIIGVLPVIETALNRAGIYHFDQIADFSDENVAWLEGHLGISGRIDREQWRQQARELAIVSERDRKVAGN